VFAVGAIQAVLSREGGEGCAAFEDGGHQEVGIDDEEVRVGPLL
jgi:hypothetical protein